MHHRLCFLVALRAASQQIEENRSERRVNDSLGHQATLALVGLVILVIAARCFQQRRRDAGRAPPGMLAVACGTCDAPQHVGARGTVFVCFQCHAVNLTPLQASEAEQPTRTYTVGRIGEDLYSVEEDGVRPAAAGNAARRVLSEAEKSQLAASLPACSVCMDSCGDMVLLPCMHGGICEPCTRQICSARAMAEALAGHAPQAGTCPVCRQPIERVSKIIDVAESAAQGPRFKAAEVNLPIANFVGF